MTSLDGLRALEQAATPGPWRSEFFDGSPRGWHVRSDRIETLADFGDDPTGEADAALVVAARNALPDLLDRVAAAEAERDALREALDLARAVKFEHHAVHEMRLGEDCVICAKPGVRAKLDRIAVLVASVPSGPAAGPTTSKETR